MSATLANVLKGTRIKHEAVQSIQGLTILPLVCPAEFSLDNRYANPLELLITTKRGYGKVDVINDGYKDYVIMPHTTFITKYAAQDHLLSKGGLVKGRSVCSFDDSRCVQSSQGGEIRQSREGIRQLIAPLALREVAWSKANRVGYNEIWKDLAVFNNAHNAGKAQQIKDYYEKWDSDLEKFIAHFERLDNCIGFITLYKGEIIAIDKFPSFTYTKQIWNTLVRDCYASLVIQDRLKNTIDHSNPFEEASTAITLVDDIGDWADSMLNYVENGFNEHYRELLQEMMEVEFKATSEDDGWMLDSEGYMGQVVEDNDFNVLVNIIKKQRFNPMEYRKANALRKRARKQMDFRL